MQMRTYNKNFQRPSNHERAQPNGQEKFDERYMHSPAGAVPAIQCVALALIIPDTRLALATRRSNRVSNTKAPVIIIPLYRMLGGGT